VRHAAPLDDAVAAPSGVPAPVIARPTPRVDPLAGRLAWITGLRLAFSTLLLGATSLLYFGGELAHYPYSFKVVFGVIAASFTLAAAYAFALRARFHLAVIAEAQIILDQVTWTALVYVSGGATSGATSFYALTCLVGAILVGARGAVTAFGTGLALYGAMCAGFYLRWIGPPPDQPLAAYVLSGTALLYPLLVNTIGILLVAILAGYLAERLRITGGALEEAQHRARESERLAELGRIAAWLAHEIRNPLGSISGSIELLRESSLSDEDKQLFWIVRREVTRLNDLVGDMLDLSKPRALVPRRVDVAALAREVVALAEHRDQAPDVTVAYDGPSGEAAARCDEPQMRQLLWNLVRNAVQASPPGGHVRVGVSEAHGVIELRVEDSGPGIAEDAKGRIFDAFYTKRSHGAGIGLAVVKRIVDEHASLGARIRVEDLAPRGAAFCVDLPAQPQPTTAPLPRTSVAPRAS